MTETIGKFRKRPMGLGLLATAAVLFGLLQNAAPAGADASLPIFSGGGSFGITVKSYKDQSFKEVVQQQYDFSCGAAAVATLLTYHYSLPTNEEEVFSVMYNRGDQARIQREGFSLLDMKAFLESRGFRADGYRIGLDKLTEAKVPAIVLTNTNGYLHFVVVKGVTGDKVLVADPAQGNKILPRDQFEATWNGLLFVILDNAEMAQEFFNAEQQWQIRHKAPIAQNHAKDGAGAFSLLLPGGNFF